MDLQLFHSCYCKRKKNRVCIICNSKITTNQTHVKCKFGHRTHVYCIDEYLEYSLLYSVNKCKKCDCYVV